MANTASGIIPKDLAKEISSRDLKFYLNQRATLEGRLLIPLTTAIGTKAVQLVDLAVCILFIITFLHRLIFKTTSYKRRFHKFTQHFFVPENKKEKLEHIFSNMIESTISPSSLRTDLTIYIIIMLVTLCRILYVHIIVEPEQSQKFNCTNDAKAFEHHTRPMYAIVPNYMTNITVNEQGQIEFHYIPNSHPHPDSYYVPKHFIPVYMACALMFAIILLSYIFCSVYHHRLGIRDLVLGNKDSKTVMSNKPEVEKQITSLLGQLVCLSTSTQYEMVKTEDDGDTPQKPLGRILIEGEDYTKLLNRDSIFVYVIGENAYYGCIIMVLVRFADFIGVLVTGYMAGTKSLQAEIILTAELGVVLIIVVVYCFFDVMRMGARAIVVPYVYFVCIPLGMIFELSAFHVNRLCTDILAIVILIVTIMIALPIHFWKNTSEFMKRHVNEMPKNTTKQWEIESHITKKEK